MPIALRSWSRSFATRERAREIARHVLAASDPEPTIDFAGVMVSPSFLAEFLQTLVTGGTRPTLVGLNDLQVQNAERLLKQLHLAGSVRIDPRLPV